MNYDKKSDKLYLIIPAAVIVVAVLCVVWSAASGWRSVYRYAGQISGAAREYDLDPALLAAVAKAESGFNKDAVSEKGAVGLMQLLPETAGYIADKIGYGGQIRLKDPQCNVTLGAAYLRYLFEKFDGEFEVLCAYNAGEGRVRGWLEDETLSSDGKTLTVVPFKETREYVARVLKYKKQFDGSFAKSR